MISVLYDGIIGRSFQHPYMWLVDLQKNKKNNSAAILKIYWFVLIIQKP